ncbi:MAG: hypothetical protein ACOYKJ_07035 [Candidatus Howiella sp.]|jgi:hypothetical protein
MTMPYDTDCGRRENRREDEHRPCRCCSAIIYTVLVGLLAAALGLVFGALLAVPVFFALPVILVFAAIIAILIVLKIITDFCARR